MKALTTFSKGVYKEIGKDSPDEIVFWICLFALNQHQKAKEVGSSLEHAPFNIALAKAKYGAVMVLDALAMPIQRIWCNYEISRAKEFDKSFQLITDDGDIANSSVETLEQISECMLRISAFDAVASDQSDKMKIQYQIVDPWVKSEVGSFDEFKSKYNAHVDNVCESVNNGWFAQFDRHICTLMGKPLLTAGLKLNSKEVCTRALGMGAVATVANLEEVTKLGVDVSGKFEAQFGTIGLSILYADMGLADELRYILDQGGNVQEKAKNEYNYTALHLAALNGHTKAASVLLDSGAGADAKEDSGYRPLHSAAWNGHTVTATLLLDRGADINAKNNNGENAYYCATQNGHSECAKLLRDRGAEDA